MHTLTEKINFIGRVFGAYDLQRNEKNISVRCPVCKQQLSLGKKKLAIRLDDDYCHCWVCGYKARSLVYLLKKYFKDDLKEYLEVFYTGTKSYDFAKLDKEKSVISLPKDFRLLALAKNNHPDVRAIKIYCEKIRGLSKHDLWYYKLGVSLEPRWRRRVLFPSFDKNGNLNDFVGRSIDNKFPKYDSPEQDNKLNNIFNELYVDWSQQLVLCEGPFDLVKCGENAVPVLGSNLNEESKLFEKIVLNKTPIALAYDADMLTTKVPKTVKKLQEYNVPVVVVKVTDDPGAMTKQEFANALNNAKPYTWNDRVRDKIKRCN